MNVLPLGLNVSPWIFTKAMRQVINHWSRQGIYVIGYFDDFILLASTRELLLI